MDSRLKSLADNKGVTDAFGLVGGAILVVVGVAVLFVGILIKSEIKDAINRSSFSGAENTTFDQISSNADTAFTLLGVAMIVAGAAIIINILRMAF